MSLLILAWSYALVRMKREPGDIPPPLYYTASFGYPRTCSLLLEQKFPIDWQGDEVERKMYLEHRGDVGSPLVVASRDGHEQIVRLLLDAGADPWSESDTFCCALQAAIFRGEEGCIKRLLELPRLFDHCKKIGYWPLIHASEKGYASVVELLINAGAQVNDRTLIPNLMLSSYCSLS